MALNLLWSFLLGMEVKFTPGKCDQVMID